MSFKWDIKWHKDHLIVYKGAEELSKLITNGADIKSELSLSIDEVDIDDDNYYLATLVHSIAHNDEDAIKANNYIKSLSSTKWKKGVDKQRQFLESGTKVKDRYLFENIYWRFRIQSWANDSCTIQWKEEREEIPATDNDLGYELHNIDGKDIIVKTRQVIKGIKCPKGYSMADSFFNYKGE